MSKNEVHISRDEAHISEDEAKGDDGNVLQGYESNEFDIFLIVDLINFKDV